MDDGLGFRNKAKFKVRAYTGAYGASVVLLLAYFVTSLFDKNSLSVPRLELTVICYITFLWGRQVYQMIRNTFEQKQPDRTFVASGSILLWLMSIGLIAFIDNQNFVHRLFTFAPIIVGLGFVAFRNVREVQTSRAIWQWSHLNSDRFRAYAAKVHGAVLILRGVLNEVFVAVAIDVLWVISLALVPQLLRRFSDRFIVWGLIRRGGVLRPR